MHGRFFAQSLKIILLLKFENQLIQSDFNSKYVTRFYRNQNMSLEVMIMVVSLRTHLYWENDFNLQGQSLLILEEQLSFEYYFNSLNFSYYTMMGCYSKYFSFVVILILYFLNIHSSMEEELLDYFASSIRMD